MKKIKTILLALAMVISFTFIGDAIGLSGSTAVNAQDKVYYKTKRGSKRVYSKGKWVTVTTWRNGKRITKKVWKKGKWVGYKTAGKTKSLFRKAEQKLP